MLNKISISRGGHHVCRFYLILCFSSIVLIISARLSRRNIKNVILNDVYHIVPAVVPVYFPAIIARCDIKNIQSLYPKADAG